MTQEPLPFQTRIDRGTTQEERRFLLASHLAYSSASPGWQYGQIFSSFPEFQSNCPRYLRAYLSENAQTLASPGCSHQAPSPWGS